MRKGPIREVRTIKTAFKWKRNDRVLGNVFHLPWAAFPSCSEKVKDKLASLFGRILPKVIVRKTTFLAGYFSSGWSPYFDLGWILSSSKSHFTYPEAGWPQGDFNVFTQWDSQCQMGALLWRNSLQLWKIQGKRQSPEAGWAVSVCLCCSSGRIALTLSKAGSKIDPFWARFKQNGYEMKLPFQAEKQHSHLENWRNVRPPWASVVRLLTRDPHRDVRRNWHYKKVERKRK